MFVAAVGPEFKDDRVRVSIVKFIQKQFRNSMTKAHVIWKDQLAHLQPEGREEEKLGCDSKAATVIVDSSNLARNFIAYLILFANHFHHRFKSHSHL